MRANPFLFLLVFLLPLQNIYLGKILSLGGGFNFLNIMLFSAALFSFRVKDSRFLSPIGPYIIFMIVSYVLAYIQSGIYLGSYDPNAIHILKDTLFPYLCFFIAYKSCTNISTLKKLFWATVLPLPYMFRVYSANLSWMGFSHYSDKLRINSGTFMDLGSNEINAFYATYTFVVFSVALYERNRIAKCFLFLCCAMNIYSIIYGFSRGAYLSIIIGSFIFAALASQKKWLWAIALTAVLVVGFGDNFLPQATIERFQTIFSDEENRDQSAQSRIEFWDLASDLYIQNPVSGIGFGNFRHISPMQLDTHNYFTKVMVENGTVGLLALLLFLWHCLKNILELYRGAPRSFLKGLSAGMIPCIASIIIGNLFGDRFTHYPLISYFFIYMAIVMRGLDIVRQEKAHEISNGVTSHQR